MGASKLVRWIKNQIKIFWLLLEHVCLTFIETYRLAWLWIKLSSTINGILQKKKYQKIPGNKRNCNRKHLSNIFFYLSFCILFGALISSIISQVFHMKQKNKGSSKRRSKTSRSSREKKSAFKCFRLIYDCWRHYWESQVQQHAAFYCFSCKKIKNNNLENLVQSASATELLTSS